jgi:hypothetical protein
MSSFISRTLNSLRESQKLTSKATSINKGKLPRHFGIVAKQFGWEKGTTHLDIGGGRFDNAIEHLEGQGITGHVYDPYNRTEEHNANAISMTKGAHTASLFNVLNVIQEPENQIAAIRVAHEQLRPDGRVFIGVYEGDRSGVGKQTGKDQFQHNQPLESYLPMVQQVFPNASVHKGIIHGTKEEL